jgi:hypothetical protein
LLYYSIIEPNIDWVRKACNICNIAVPPKAKKLPIKPIIPTGMMDELVVDFIDFTNKTDRNIN